MKITIPEISLNTHDFSSGRLPTQSMTHPHRHFRHKISLSVQTRSYSTIGNKSGARMELNRESISSHFITNSLITESQGTRTFLFSFQPHSV
jgi:hypothetical protein